MLVLVLYLSFPRTSFLEDRCMNMCLVFWGSKIHMRRSGRIGFLGLIVYNVCNKVLALATCKEHEDRQRQAAAGSMGQRNRRRSMSQKFNERKTQEGRNLLLLPSCSYS